MDKHSEATSDACQNKAKWRGKCKVADVWFGFGLLENCVCQTQDSVYSRGLGKHVQNTS